jgi:subtilisin family serine protease
MKFKMRSAYIATLLALGSAANAERMIVTFENTNSKTLGVKSSHKVLAEGSNWIAVDLDTSSMKSMMSLNGFKSMEIDAKRYPMSAYNDTAGNPNSVQVTPYNYFQIQADQLTYQGGQKVCVIDSGIARETGDTGGTNADFDWSVITGNSDSGTNQWYRDGGAHGTHVAGTIGAVDNGFGIIGIAPGVPMHIIKVFNDSGWGYSSDLAQAANLCAAAGANIINMSLGGGGANSTEENAFINFRNNGGLVVAAAGNDGNNVRSYPAGYPAVMMIGGVDADNAKYTGSQYPSCNGGDETTCVEIAAGAVDVLSTVPSGTGAIAALTVDGSGVVVSATANTGTVTDSTYFMGTAESTDAGANGKICIIDRGNISFSDKVNNCGNSGGTGAVIINNVAGGLSMDITGATTNIPVVGAAFEDRATIVGASTATIDSGAGNYAKFTGTSMATPTFAGAAALVWSNHPNCTGEDVRAAFKATAQDQGAAGRDVEFGYGIAKAKAASDNLSNQACSGGPVNAAPTASFTQSCSGLSCTFNGSGSSDSDGSIVGYSWSIGGSSSTASNTYASYGTYSVTLTVTDDGGATDSTTQSVVLTDPNQSTLTNGVAKTGLSDSKDSEQNWTMVVPAGATDLTFNISGGSGDADLYVRYGSAPTTSTYDCRPYVGGNTEACPVASAQAGTYHVMVRAYSAYSGLSLVGSYTAGVANVAPNASFGSSCTDLSCSFNASTSSDSDGSITNYSWSFGGSGVNATNTFASAGTYSVTLTVTDDDGATDTSTSSVTVTAPPVNVAPTASFTSNCTDLTCSFNASGSSDSDGSIANYSWSFGGSGVNASNTFASAGTYSVTLTVTDDDGATDTSTSSVTVTAPPVGNNVLVNGVAKTGLSATKDNNLNFTMVVPAGATSLNFAINGGSGDADLYVRFGSAPTTSNYDCRPYVGGNNESCPISTAQAGTYYVMVRAYSTFSGVSLTGSYTADTGGGGGQSVFSSTSNVNIPDNNTSGATSNISVNRTGQAGNVKITYSIVHTYIGDLKVDLIAPNGTTATLRSNSGGSANNISESVDVNAGTTSASGTWGLKVTDSAGQDTGYIDSWSIEFL